ncbi:hypothetical protein ANABIO32_02770 [Rossellomorea marisflavi]|nr:hypothetical protein ANABIO32_02770 [Rossellomorea marisflavi]
MNNRDIYERYNLLHYKAYKDELPCDYDLKCKNVVFPKSDHKAGEVTVSYIR